MSGVVLQLAYLSGAMAALLLGILGFSNLIMGLVKFVAVSLFHQKKVLATLPISVVLAAGIVKAITGELDIAASLGLWVLVFPLPIYYLINWWCWKLDDKDRRSAALAIRLELAQRMEARAPRGKWPWRQYLLDSEMSRKRESFVPPPI